MSKCGQCRSPHAAGTKPGNDLELSAAVSLDPDACDLDDGRVLFDRIEDSRVSWQGDPACTTCKLYRVSLAILFATGEEPRGDGSGLTRPNAHPCP